MTAIVVNGAVVAVEVTAEVAYPCAAGIRRLGPATSVGQDEYQRCLFRALVGVRRSECSAGVSVRSVPSKVPASTRCPCLRPDNRCGNSSQLLFTERSAAARCLRH